MISQQKAQRGFSLLELVIVLAVIMVVAAIATPAIMSALNDYKLRTAAGNVAGVIQKTRMQAVSDDRWHPVAIGSSGGSSYAFADLEAPPNYSLEPSNAAEQNLVAYLPRGMSFDGSSGPSLASMNLDFSPNSGMPAFNARGLPCAPSGSICPPASGGNGFYYYLRQNRSAGTLGWAAITVSPAGRVRVWIWTGSTWN